MGLHLDQRPDGGVSLYIDGDFQFDSADEAIYHESLALPALSLVHAKLTRPLRVLICGGGDGLALRECLRFPDVQSIDLVDYDRSIVDLARTRLAEINGHAFDDPRVTVHFEDAWTFLDRLLDAHGTVPSPNGDRHERRGRRKSGADYPRPAYDVIVCDFTVPRTPEQAHIFTIDWYRRLSALVGRDGLLAINAFSPQTTPEAFWCLRRTVRAAGLNALPYRVCIPSFRAHGYGVWAFLLAGKRPLTIRDLQALECPVPTRLVDLPQLWRGARFHLSERRIERTVPIHSLENNCLLPLLLNPGLRSKPGGGVGESAPYDLEPLVRAIPITHAYHTRVMIETLAEQVAATVNQIDVRRLVEALLRRVARLPHALLEELLRLRDFLSDVTLEWDRFVTWGARLFAALVILMTLANAIAPDNAFAKGGAGLGHSSVSRGFSSSFGHSGSFGSGSSARGGSFSGSGSRGSFGRTGAFGSHSIFDSTVSAPTMHSRGFVSSYGTGRPVDIYGDEYNMRPFHYYYGGTHSYFSIQPNMPQPGPQVEHRPLFAADDDLLVMDNGDTIVTLSDHAFLLVKDGSIVLRSDQSQDPLCALYPDPAFFQNVIGELRDRQASAEQAIGVRRDWLSWVGWTSVMLPAVARDKTELAHLQDLDKRLDAAIARIGQPPAGATPLPPLPRGQVELFVDARLRQDGRIALRQADGTWLLTDGRSISPEISGAATPPTINCPPGFASALGSVVAKLKKETTADIKANDNDMLQLRKDLASLQNDLAQYTSLQASHGDVNYEVDYGTDEIPVWDAIKRTQRDIDQTNKDIAQTQAERDKMVADQNRMEAVAPAFRQ